jgi:hypothetical protein
MTSLPRQYDIYLGRWRNNGGELQKVEMTDLETNYSFYDCGDNDIPVGFCFSKGGWLCEDLQTPENGKSMWMIPRHDMNTWNFGTGETPQIYNVLPKRILNGQLMRVQFNHSYACQCHEGSDHVYHFRVVEKNVEDIDEEPPFQNHEHDELLGVDKIDNMTDLLLRLESMKDD